MARAPRAKWRWESALDEAHLNGGLLGLLDLGEADHDEGDHEDGEGDHEGGGGVGDLSLGHITDEGTHEDVAGNGSRRVEHAAELDELIAFVAATAEDVEHGVDNAVEDTHAETGDESTDEINCKHGAEVGLGVHETAHPLDEDTGGTDGKTDKSSLLIAELGYEHTCGNTHHKVGHEVAVVAYLCENV